jgi:hypothetical protein
MLGLVPSIHAFVVASSHYVSPGNGVDRRDKPDDDDREELLQKNATNSGKSCGSVAEPSRTAIIAGAV